MEIDEVSVDIITFFRVPLTPIRYFWKNICKKTGGLYAFIKCFMSRKVGPLLLNFSSFLFAILLQIS